MSTYNWSHIDEEAMKKTDPEKYRRWKLVQMLNYDSTERLDKDEIKELWPEVKYEIDPYTRRVIDFLLFDKTYQLPPAVDVLFWNRPAKYRCPVCRCGFNSVGVFKKFGNKLKKPKSKLI